MSKFTYIIGDITEQTEGLILHGVNASYAMGSGVALAIRNKWPKAYDSYMEVDQGQLALGMLQIVFITNNLMIGNGFTQLHYGSDGKKYAREYAVREVLEEAYRFCSSNKIVLKTVKIGCLRGGLDWETEVLPIFEELNKQYDISVEIYDIK